LLLSEEQPVASATGPVCERTWTASSSWSFFVVRERPLRGAICPQEYGRLVGTDIPGLGSQ